MGNRLDSLDQVANKIGFVIHRLQEMKVFCEYSRDVEPSIYTEQSHFLIGLCGKVLDDARELLGHGRNGTFDESADLAAIGSIAAFPTLPLQTTGENAK